MVDLFISTKPKKSGWYKWHMTRNMQVPVYEWISPHLGYKKENNNTEYMAILPDDFDDEEEWEMIKDICFLIGMKCKVGMKCKIVNLNRTKNIHML